MTAPCIQRSGSSYRNAYTRPTVVEKNSSTLPTQSLVTGFLVKHFVLQDVRCMIDCMTLYKGSPTNIHTHSS